MKKMVVHGRITLLLMLPSERGVLRERKVQNSSVLYDRGVCARKKCSPRNGRVVFRQQEAQECRFLQLGASAHGARIMGNGIVRSCSTTVHNRSRSRLRHVRYRELRKTTQQQQHTVKVLAHAVPLGPPHFKFTTSSGRNRIRRVNFIRIRRSWNHTLVDCDPLYQAAA